MMGFYMRRTKIIATVGPASDDDGVLDSLIAAGTDIFRLNFSHGTAYSQSATVGISYPLSEHWQAAIDATVADYSGTPASGLVDAIPDPGIEVYLSGQLTGTGIFTENDSVAFGLRYAENDTSRLYLGDLSVRYPFNEDLRINPRLRLSLRNGKTSDTQQLLVMPSLGLRYRLSKHWNFEVEAGMRWENDWSPGANDQNTELLLNAGYRYEF